VNRLGLSLSLTFVKKTAKLYEIEPYNVIILDVIEGSIQVIFVIYDPKGSFTVSNKTKEDLIAIYGADAVSMKLHPFLKAASISEKMIDIEGNRDFTYLCNTFTRGGYDYKQPGGWKGYGINVSKKYDNNDDSWLAMDNNPKEWAVAYHGIREGDLTIIQAAGRIIDPDKIPDVDSRSLQQINGEAQQINGKPLQTSKNQLIPGNNQFWENSSNENKKTQHLHRKVPAKGIYCTPDISIAKGYAGDVKIEKKKYKLVLMLRIRPESITYPKTVPSFWVIEKPADVRPYRILLYKD